jgi:hypothetical protein
MKSEDEALAERKRDSSSNARKQRQHSNDDISTTQMSLAAMSTCTATSTGALDDASSMGGETHTTQQTNYSKSTRRKRKDDCSESRCTVNSEESRRSRSRRRRSGMHDPSCHRWLARIDHTAATSNAPIRPIRSDDDDSSYLLHSKAGADIAIPPALATDSLFRFQQYNHQNQLRTFSATLPRIEGQTRPTFGAMGNASANVRNGTTTRSGRRFSDADTLSAREVARSQSLSLPPVRPTRTRDDSKIDLMASDDDDSDDDRSSAAYEKYDSARALQNTTANNEIDPYMFARLLQGQLLAPATTQYPLCHIPFAPLRSEGAASDNVAASSDPPKKPRRCSDADVYVFPTVEKQRSHNAALTRFNTIADVSESGRTQESAARSASNRTGRCTSMRQEACPHSVSPKPPTMPSRTIDGRRLMDIEKIALPRPAPPHDLDAHSHCNVPRVSDAEEKEDAAVRTKDGPTQARQLGDSKNQMSCSSCMDLELADEEEDPPTNAKNDVTTGGAAAPEADAAQEKGIIVKEDDEYTEVSTPVSFLDEYDQELFARLLHGEEVDDTTTSRTGLWLHRASALSSKITEEGQPPHALLARVSSGTATATQPAFDRFDNIAGAVKSSHPPMRPRRSIDECTLAPDSLAAAAAAACVAHVNDTYMRPAPLVDRPIGHVSGKWRACRRPSRRSTLPLASEMPSSDSAPTALSRAEGNVDPAQEDNVVVFSKQLDTNAAHSWLVQESHCDSETYGEDPENEREHPTEDAGEEVGPSLYSRITPARRRRRVVRRFTMPSKGRSLSPQAKKPRVVGRSVSYIDHAEDEMTPASQHIIITPIK